MPAPDVALVAPYPTAGQRHAGPTGVASYVANLSHSLAARGATVEVVAPVEPDAPDEPRRTRDGPITIQRPFRRGARGLIDAASAASATGAPVVHLQHELFLYGGARAVPALVPALYGLRRRAGAVVTLHQVVEPRTVDRSFTALHRVPVPAPVARHALAGVQRSVAGLARACIVHEHPFAATVPGAVVIPHGVEDRLGADRAGARAALGLDDRLVVLCFGFLAPYKGLETALAAGRRLGADRALVVVAGGPHPRLAAAGDRYADDLRARFEGAGARFTGWVPEDDLGRWFAAADVAALPYPAPFSSSGAFALALAHRTPVLLSEPLAACVGAPEPLVAGPGVDGWADRLRACLDPAMRERLRSATADLAARRAWPAVAEAHLDLYDQVAR